MIWRNADQAELAVDIAAAAILAVAVGFAIWAGASGVETAASIAAATLFAAIFGLRRVKPKGQAHAVPPFPLKRIEQVQELPDELILDDALAEVDPHARVVQLFGPGQNHLPPINGGPADASQALVEALAELRRSLR
jgi:hypothetical protein